MTNRLKNSVQPHTIFNHKDEPLKCIVTKYPSTVELLSESGALVVLDQTDIVNELKDTNYRELYLGDCFIGGGYGVYKKEQQDKLIEIISEFDRIIQDLHLSDEDIRNYAIAKYTELLKNKLDINCKNDDNSINEQADASDTFVRFTNADDTVYYIRTEDILQLMSNLPVYENLEITNISYTIVISDYTGNMQTFTDTTHLPINTYIRQVTVDITLNLHDCGKINSIILEWASSNENNEISYTNIQYDTSNISTNNNLDNSETHIRLSRSYDSISYRVKEGENNIIKSIILDIQGTPASKFKSINNVFDLKTNQNVQYTYNAIKDQVKTIDMPSVIGDYFLSYYANNRFEQTESNIINNLIYAPLNADTYTELVIEPGTKMIVLIVPISYIVYDVYLHTNNDVNITNFVNYYPYNNANNAANANIVINKLNSSVYIINLSTGLKSISKLRIFTKSTSTLYENIYNDVNNKLMLSGNPKYILNGDYLHTYWIDDNSKSPYKNNQISYITSLQYNNL